jgi:hypothetical protein
MYRWFYTYTYTFYTYTYTLHEAHVNVDVEYSWKILCKCRGVFLYILLYIELDSIHQNLREFPYFFWHFVIFFSKIGHFWPKFFAAWQFLAKFFRCAAIFGLFFSLRDYLWVNFFHTITMARKCIFNYSEMPTKRGKSKISFEFLNQKLFILLNKKIDYLFSI